ncbi:MAG: hypothetical protein J6W09_08385 [Bacteroidales bacterium]|nr:hypothetical protein [Bacteroidales bacterium]
MKKTLIVIIAALAMSGCGYNFKLGTPDPDLFAGAKVQTLSTIVGNYTLTEAKYSQSVAISKQASPSKDLRQQLFLYGFMGIQSTFVHLPGQQVQDAFHSSVVLNQDANDIGQVNLYMPYSFNQDYIDHNFGADLPDDPCFVEMEMYQFYYTVNNSGRITVNNSEEWASSNMTNPLSNITVEMGSGRISISADTSFYDYTTGSFKEGQLTLCYIRSN